jgi:hypothetical protein
MQRRQLRRLANFKHWDQRPSNNIVFESSYEGARTRVLASSLVADREVIALQDFPQ